MLVKAKSIDAVLNEMFLDGYFVVKINNNFSIFEKMPTEILSMFIKRDGNIFTVLPLFKNGVKEMKKEVDKIIIEKKNRKYRGVIVFKDKSKVHINVAHALYFALLLRKQVYVKYGKNSSSDTSSN